MAGAETLPKSNPNKIFERVVFGGGGASIAVTILLAGLHITPPMPTFVVGGIISAGIIMSGAYLANNVIKAEERHKPREKRMEEGRGETTPLLSSHLESQKAQVSAAAPKAP